MSVNPQLQAVLEQCNRFILGKEHQLRLSLACLLARGHLLLEDLPGVGKTTLAHVLSHTLGLDFNRIQFTSDLLPADILGASVYERNSGEFRFHPGPVFTNVVLADEINRATPKSQSALLEAMEEYQVSVEGETRALPTPFFVIATQNPAFQIGTFPLPESQLDRFLMVLSLGYPDHAAERALLAGEDRRDMLNTIRPVMSAAELAALQQQVRQVHASDALLDYIQALIDFSRQSPHFVTGLSPRAGLSLLNAARAWAFLEGRDHLLPEDVQEVLGPVVTHRLHSGESGQDMEQIVRHFNEVAIP